MGDAMSGCSCCGGCRPTRTYATTSKWTTGTGGTITDNGDGFDVSGEVSPSSLVNSEAYTINFTMTGYVSIDIDGDTFVIDGPNQQIEIGLDTVLIGQAGRLGARTTMEVEIRITPSHAYLLVNGNYYITRAGFTGYAYGLLTVDRSSAVPTGITMTWTLATVKDFTVSDSKVVMSGTDYDPVVDLSCWTQPTPTCPYTYLKDLTRNHLYQDEPEGEVGLPDVSFGGWDPFVFASGGGVSKADSPCGYALACNTDSGGNLSDPTSLYQTIGYNDPYCHWGDHVRLWIYNSITGNYDCKFVSNYIFGASNQVFTAGGEIGLIFDAPTPSSPYPKPRFLASLTVTWQGVLACCWDGVSFVTFQGFSSSTATTDIAANDLKSGFTLSISGDKFTESGVPTCDPGTFGPECSDVWDDVGLITATWTL